MKPSKPNYRNQLWYPPSFWSWFWPDILLVAIALAMAVIGSWAATVIMMAIAAVDVGLGYPAWKRLQDL